MNVPDSMTCFLVRQIGKDVFESGIESRPLRELPAGDVLIRVQRTSLNYKDALAASGHGGIVRKFPHVPGIDAAGVVISSESPRFRTGDIVLATGHELGVERWGGWSEFLRVPAEWVWPLPVSLSVDEAMGLGTAGFTAAQCVQALQRHGISPDRGDILVSGATGGVASLAISILAKLGYAVVAVSSKIHKSDWLKKLGAARVLSRTDFLNAPARPLLSAQYAGCIDTVGGELLSTMLRMVHHRGCVACCGVAGGATVSTTVYPFILRGVTLCGIDSAWCPDHLRPEIWEALAGPWKPPLLTEITSTIFLSGIKATAAAMLRGETFGRTVITLEHGSAQFPVAEIPQ